MQVSQNGINLAKKWEGFYPNAYLDPVGIPTIGYGTTRINGQKVKLGTTITLAQAEYLLKKDMEEHASNTFKYIKIELNQNQFDALASFQYNLGKDILQGSNLTKLINTKQWKAAAEKMKEYNKAGGRVLQGLVNRRNEEAALFLRGDVSLGGNSNRYTLLTSLPYIATNGVKRTYASDKAWEKATELGLSLTSAYRPVSHSLSQQNPKSDHIKGTAYDFAAPMTDKGKKQMDEFAKWAHASKLYKQVIWQGRDMVNGWAVAGHYHHVHVAWKEETTLDGYFDVSDPNGQYQGGIIIDGDTPPESITITRNRNGINIEEITYKEDETHMALFVQIDELMRFKSPKDYFGVSFEWDGIVPKVDKKADLIGFYSDNMRALGMRSFVVIVGLLLIYLGFKNMKG